MKITLYICTLLLWTSCCFAQEKPPIQYTALQLEKYLDSIGALPTAPLAEKVSFVADSTFKNQLQIDQLLSESDFLKLKKVLKEKKEVDRVMDIQTAKNIFGDIQVDSSYLEKGKIPITFISFDKNQYDFNEFAICLGDPNAGWNCNIYFLKRNRIISRHTIEHHYGLAINHYKDRDGKTVIYYKENFGTGTGIWQFNLFFYKYVDNKLIPILNVLENGNLQMHWGMRIYWLEASVIKTTPLTLKMVYYQELYDTTGAFRQRIIDNSTLVQYSWNANLKTLVGNYEKTNIAQPQILTYYLADNEILFINMYYKTLKACLQNKAKRKLTLIYLNRVKNYYDH